MAKIEKKKRGTKKKTHKVSQKDWMWARAEYETGTMSIASICRKLGVTTQALGQKRIRDGWEVTHRQSLRKEQEARTKEKKLQAALLAEEKIERSNDRVPEWSDADPALIKEINKTVDQIVQDHKAVAVKGRAMANELISEFKLLTYHMARFDPTDYAALGDDERKAYLTMALSSLDKRFSMLDRAGSVSERWINLERRITGIDKADQGGENDPIGFDNSYEEIVGEIEKLKTGVNAKVEEHRSVITKLNKENTVD